MLTERADLHVHHPSADIDLSLDGKILKRLPSVVCSSRDHTASGKGTARYGALLASFSHAGDTSLADSVVAFGVDLEQEVLFEEAAGFTDGAMI